jgi:hypothetical protein
VCVCVREREREKAYCIQDLQIKHARKDQNSFYLNSHEHHRQL